jgi:hypothetical protein
VAAEDLERQRRRPRVDPSEENLRGVTFDRVMGLSPTNHRAVTATGYVCRVPSVQLNPPGLEPPAFATQPFHEQQSLE